MSAYSNPDFYDLKPNNLNIFFDHLELWIAREKNWGKKLGKIGVRQS